MLTAYGYVAGSYLLFCGARRARQKISQKRMALFECQFAVLVGSFVGAIFDLHTNWPSVTAIGQGRKELAPIDFAHAGKLRKMPQIRMRKIPNSSSRC